jgi:putative flippase GtrA
VSVPLLLRRWVKFNAVGAMGILVQLVALAVLAGPLRIHYLVATALAVEAAVLHNFVWHCRWTWKDRAGGAARLAWVLGALWRFHVSNGLVSMAGNLLFMRLLVGRLYLHYLAANLLSIALCSLANFLLSEWFVFRTRNTTGSSPPATGGRP